MIKLASRAITFAPIAFRKMRSGFFSGLVLIIRISSAMHVALNCERIRVLVRRQLELIAETDSPAYNYKHPETEPNKAMEGMRLLVTASAFALPAPSNRIPHLER